MTSKPQGQEPELRAARQLVVDGRRWDVFVEAQQDTDGRSRVAYVFRLHDARPGRPAEERRTSGYDTSIAATSEDALLQLFRDAS